MEELSKKTLITLLILALLIVAIGVWMGLNKIEGSSSITGTTAGGMPDSEEHIGSTDYAEGQCFDSESLYKSQEKNL